MSAAPLFLRIKSKAGQHKINNLTLQSSVGCLLEKIEEATHVPCHVQRLLHGFPPSHVDTSDYQVLMSTLPFRSGDTVIVQEDRTPSSTSTTPGGDVHQSGWKCQDSVNSVESTKESTSRGILTRKVVPADNSCLFTSIALVTEGGETNRSHASQLRDIIAQVVSSNPEMYCEAFLGKPNTEYCAWILHQDSWGGAIEISILSEFYALEIDVLDTQSIRVDRFGESKGYKNRAMLIYDNIHYDPLVLEPVNSGEPIQTVFSTDDDWILAQALELATEANRSKQYTDLTGFTLRCLVCNDGLRGQRQAQQHAMATGHANFAEY